MKRKPGVYGATAIRVVLPGARYEWFYDVVEAVEFVTKNWAQGTELSARVLDGNVYRPVFIITEEGEAYASPLYAKLLAQAPIKMEIAL